ncbi:MAG: virulence factor [Dehalococcoidia bacterium]|nr:virulence factor [Dehalococcoidia bacterium]MDP7262124.1 virulence factor [Dehalococcoidia bacterium]MDP7486163.1 virulence factor [Dehalococcoidia bacterium]
MARVRVMYWKEIPIQVQAEDEEGNFSRPLDERFQKAIDAVAMKDGSEGTDAYLDAWDFGSFSEIEGNAADSAEKIAINLEKMPSNFVKRIFEMQRNGSRVPTPGAIDHWIES